MNFPGKPGRRFIELSPAVIREIVIIAIILCIAVVLSLPQYHRDMQAAEEQKKELQADKSFAAEDPGKYGMDPARLDLASKALESTSALSLLVMRNGSLVYEKYFNNSGNNIQSRNNIFSVTKSFMSALIGIAIQKGYIGGVDEPIQKYLPEYFSEQTDPRWKKITLKHLLTMTPGFCENLDQLNSSKDWVKYTLGLPLNYDPGEKFQYANSSSHLLSVILTKATDMSTKEFADKYLFDCLDISDPEWAQAPDGCYTGYANLYLRPRDLARFGWLYCCNGKWDGVQVVPEAWVSDSTKVQYDFNMEKDADGKIADKMSVAENGYGYQWWIRDISGYHTFSALGYGGQSITIVPDLKLVVVITCIPDSASLNDEQREQLLNEYIIAAIRK